MQRIGDAVALCVRRRALGLRLCPRRINLMTETPAQVRVAALPPNASLRRSFGSASRRSIGRSI
jgi:hypothetical protein